MSDPRPELRKLYEEEIAALRQSTQHLRLMVDWSDRLYPRWFALRTLAN